MAGTMVATLLDLVTMAPILVGFIKLRTVPPRTVVTSHAVGQYCDILYMLFASADCYGSCGESGHIARQCPSAPEGSGNDGKCFNCGGEG